MEHEFTYHVVLTEDASGGYVVNCPDLPELLTQGEDRADAVANAIDALEEAIAGRVRRGDDIPDPSEPPEEHVVELIRLPPIMAAKAALAIALRESGLSQSAFARETGVDEKEVRRLLDPRHPSKLPRLQKALLAVNREVEIRVVPVARPEIVQAKPRSYREIADAAETLVSELFPEAIARGGPLPVVDLLSTERLSAIAGTPVHLVIDDTMSEEGVSEHAGDMLILRLPERTRSEAASGDGRCRFTLAHEVAHIALHHQDLQQHRGCAFRDILAPIDKLPPGIPIFQSPEWQANVWAAAFLMPTAAVRRYLARLSETGEEFTREGFAANFQVSRQAASIRLEKLLPALVSGTGGDHGRDVTASPSGRG
jgi:antitoxin HicB